MKKNYLFNIIYTLTNILFPIVTFPYVSRTIGPAGVGKIQFIVSFAQYFALFAGLGIPLYGIREIAKYRGERAKLSGAFSELIIIYFLTSIVVGLVYISIVTYFDFFKHDKALYIFSASLILLGFSSIDWLYSGLEEFRLIAFRSVFIKIISVAGVFVFIKTAHDDVCFLYISIFAILGNNIINLLLVRSRLSITLKSLNFKRHFKPLVYIFTTTLATSMYTVLDTVLIGFLSDQDAVGYYTAAVKLTKISLPFITSVGAVTLPSLAKNFFTSNSGDLSLLLQKSFNFIVFFSIPIAAGSFLFAKQFVMVFSGPKFTDAIVPMQIMSLLPVLIGLGFFFGFQILVPAGLDRQLFTSVVIGMIAGIILNFVLVPHYKQTGGALANVFTESVVTLSYYFFVKRERVFKADLKIVYQTMIATVSFLPIYLLITLLRLQVFTSLLLAIAGCVLAYGIIQTFLFKNHMLVQLIDKAKVKLTPR